MYQELANWMDNLGLENAPEEAVAFCFNMYDCCDDEHWSMDLIGAERYDPEDSDWACEEVCYFEERFRWTKKAKWDTVLEEMVSLLRKYLDEGKYACVFKSKTAVAVGFDDGDLEVLYCK